MSEFECLSSSQIVYIGSYIGLSLCDLLCTFSIVSQHFSLLSQKWIQFLPGNVFKTSNHIKWLVNHAASITRLHLGTNLDIPFLSLETLHLNFGVVNFDHYPKLVNLAIGYACTFTGKHTRKLKTLSMDANWILSMNFPNLTHLDISGCNVKNNEFHMLSNFRFLVMLNLSYNNNLSTLQGLETMRDLKAINIANCAISDLTPLKKLQHLELIALTQFFYNFELSELFEMNTHLKILKETCDWKEKLLLLMQLYGKILVAKKNN
jgi:hypothetical protein